VATIPVNTAAALSEGLGLLKLSDCAVCLADLRNLRYTVILRRHESASLSALRRSGAFEPQSRVFEGRRRQFALFSGPGCRRLLHNITRHRLCLCHVVAFLMLVYCPRSLHPAVSKRTSSLHSSLFDSVSVFVCWAIDTFPYNILYIQSGRNKLSHCTINKI